MLEVLQAGRVARVTIFYAGAILLWEILVKLLQVPDWLLPTPSQIVEVIIDKNSVMLSHTLVTLYESVMGFALALILAEKLMLPWSRRETVG